VTEHSQHPGTFIMWLNRAGVDNDLQTPMVGEVAADDDE
jgi:hypothetical protein